MVKYCNIETDNIIAEQTGRNVKCRQVQMNVTRRSGRMVSVSFWLRRKLHWGRGRKCLVSHSHTSQEDGRGFDQAVRSIHLSGSEKATCMVFSFLYIYPWQFHEYAPKICTQDSNLRLKRGKNFTLHRLISAYRHTWYMETLY